MSQTAITLAFEQWKAQQAATGEPVLLDEFVFALIPGLGPSSPVDRSETLPPAAQIVHRESVSRKGVVNENAVVHSVVLGARVGDFSFNWIGLTNKASGTLAMIVHAPVQQKLKTKEGQQGNVLTRSFLMEFNGAQSETAINTPAETWQIDFTARMGGMDERQRLENIDIYGAAAFFADGWLVGKAGNQFFVTNGVGYVNGLRAALAANQNITITNKPVKVWLDVCWIGSPTSVWDVQSKITVASSLKDYEQGGIKHYVFALASIDENEKVTDLRPKGSLDIQQASRDYLRRDNNLSELTNKAVARDALELKGAALLNVGTKEGTVAAGDDDRIINALDRRAGGEVSGSLQVNNVLSLGNAGNGVFSGSTPGINIGDSDSGFLASGAGVISLYANNTAIGWLAGNGLHINQLNVTGSTVQMIGDDRKHFRVGDVDGRTRLYIYKDKGGDGVHINNGDDGGGDFVCQRNGDFWAPGALHAGNAFMQTDGNIYGSCWGGYLNIWLNNQLNAVRNRVNEAWDKANDAQANRITDIRFTAEHQVGAIGVWDYRNGNTVLTGFTNGDGDYSAEGLFWSYIQYWRSGQWITVGRS